MFTIGKKYELLRRAKAIRHTFGDRSMFKAIRYIIKFG